MAVSDKKVVLEGREAIDLWLTGREAWNEWVKENPVADVNFNGMNFAKYRTRSKNISAEWPFARFVFPTGDVTFWGASFGNGDVHFDLALFGSGKIHFNNASFGDGNVYFSRASFGEGYISFGRTSFGEGRVSFDNATFGKGYVNFVEASFGEGAISFALASFGNGDVNFHSAFLGKGDVSFSGASFGEGSVSFKSIDFESRTDFSNLQNVGVVERFSFAHSTFQGSLIISSDLPFGCVVDLTSTKINNQISLEDLQCNLKKTKSFLMSEWLGQAKAHDVKDIARFRRLKEIAGDNKDHQQALEFNAMEMQAKRWYKTNKVDLFLEFVFQKASDYGRSEVRPVICMGGLWLICSVLYCWLSDVVRNNVFDNISAAMTFSIGQMLPFAPISREARSDGMELLFSEGQLPGMVIFLASAQSVISIILIFLIGLSLRNRFKV